MQHKIQIQKRRAKVPESIGGHVTPAQAKGYLAIAWCRCGWDTKRDWLPRIEELVRQHRREHGLPMESDEEAR